MKSWSDSEGEKHYGKVFASKNGYDAIDCRTCGFIHVIPFPSEKELETYYRDTFYSDYKPDYMKQHEQDLKWWNHQFENRKLLFEQKLNPKRKPRILDVGSGPGFFLKYFQDRGWDVLGLEPGTAAVEFSRNLGVEVIQDSIDNIKELDLGAFDVIHSNQTFEHLVHPIAALKALKQTLREEGILYLVVANDFNPLQRVAQQHLGVPDWWYVPPEHVNYWNPESMSGLLEKVGYQVIHESVTFPIDLFLLMGDNYIAEPAVGKAAHNRRKELEFTLAATGDFDLRRRLYESFKNAGIGREIEVLARPH